MKLNWIENDDFASGEEMMERAESAIDLTDRPAEARYERRVQAELRPAILTTCSWQLH